jgi:hypothetical protein
VQVALLPGLSQSALPGLRWCGLLLLLLERQLCMQQPGLVLCLVLLACCPRVAD